MELFHPFTTWYVYLIPKKELIKPHFRSGFWAHPCTCQVKRILSEEAATPDTNRDVVHDMEWDTVEVVLTVQEISNERTHWTDP